MKTATSLLASLVLISSCGGSSTTAQNPLENQGTDACDTTYYQTFAGTFRGNVDVEKLPDAQGERMKCTWEVAATITPFTNPAGACELILNVTAPVSQTFVWPSTDDNAHECRDENIANYSAIQSNPGITDTDILDNLSFPQSFSVVTNISSPLTGPYSPEISSDTGTVPYFYLFSSITPLFSTYEVRADGALVVGSLDAAFGETQFRVLFKE